MKTYKQFIAESIAWQKWLGDLLFSKLGTRYIPLSKQMFRRLGLTNKNQREEWAFHSTDFKGLKNVLRMQGKAKSLSTMTRISDFDMGMEFFSEKGVQTSGDVMVAVSGDVVVAGGHDLMSAPDSQGRRWLDLEGVINSFYDDKNIRWNAMKKMSKEIDKTKSDLIKKAVNDFYMGVFSLKLSGEGALGLPTSPMVKNDTGYTMWVNDLWAAHSSKRVKLSSLKHEDDKKIVRYVRKFIGKLIKDTFDAIEKMLAPRWMPLLGAMIFGLGPQETLWNEVVLNRIEVKSVWVKVPEEYNQDVQDVHALSKKYPKIEWHFENAEGFEDELGYILQDLS